MRELFRVAAEHAPSIVFIDEIDAVGTKRYDCNSGGEREIQRTMLDLLNQLEGFDSRGDVKVSVVQLSRRLHDNYFNIVTIFWISMWLCDYVMVYVPD